LTLKAPPLGGAFIISEKRYPKPTKLLMHRIGEAFVRSFGWHQGPLRLVGAARLISFCEARRAFRTGLRPTRNEPRSAASRT